MKTTTSHQNRFYVGQIVFGLANIALCLYLMIQHTRLKVGIQDEASFCSIGRFADCDVINASRFSEVFGIPVAALGALLYFVMLVLTLLAQPRDRAFSGIQRIIFWIGLAALFVDLAVFLSLQVFILHSVCLLCVSTYLIAIATLFCVVKTHTTKTKSFFPRAKELLFDSAFPFPKDISRARLGFGALSIGLFLVLLTLLPTYIKKDAPVFTNVDDTIKKYFSEWKDRPVKKMESSPHNGVYGNPQAKVQIVEFSDFECPFCKKAAFTLHTALEPFKERVVFVFKHFPLNAKCNPNLQFEMHAHACKLALLSICANQKGKFWDLHNQIFLHTSPDIFKEGFDTISASLNRILNATEIKSCLDNKTVADSLRDDVRMGTALAIKATPSIFINGKPVEIPLTVENLQRLIEIEEKLP